MSTYVLIHGAWHASWCWHKLIPLLERQGHTVIAPDLPGHGGNQAHLENISIRAYVDYVSAILDSQSEPVILVGHSMGGVVISQVGEYRSQRIQALVYVAGYLLRNGERLATTIQQDLTSDARRDAVISADGRTIMMPKEAAEQDFYENCTAAEASLAASRLIPEATQIWIDTVRLTPLGYERIPRFYIECLRDRAVTISLQREMCRASACSDVFSIDTDHSPFLSEPLKLADYLMRIDRATVNAGGSDTS